MLVSKRLGLVEQNRNAAKNAPPLERGAKGAGVKVLQGLLYDLGFPLGNSFSTGKADGIYGPETQAAVKAFQAKQKLVADGVAGAKTFEALDQIIISDPTYELPDRAAAAHGEIADRIRPLVSRTKAMI